MAMTPTGIARTVALWVLILAASASIAVDFTHSNAVWAWFKIVVAVVVIMFEIYNYVTKKKTISTEQKEFMIRDWLWGWISLVLFAISLAGLIVHLAVW